MKKTLLSGLLLFAAAATFTSCAKDETSDLATTAQATISATLGEPTRTMLEGEKVKWVADDKILLANAGNGTTAMYTLTTGAGQVNGTFTGDDLGAGEKFAFYPYSTTVTHANGKVLFEMPATQTYAATTFGNGANPMIAKSDAQGVLNFKNTGGVIKLTLKGTQKVGKIVVSTELPTQKLSGKASLVFDAEGLPVVTMDIEAATAVTLECNNAQLDAETATPFYIVVPAATYEPGMQFAIYDETGAPINSLITTKKLDVKRSRVAPLPEKTMAATAHFPDARFRTLLNKTYGLKLTTDGTDDIDVNDETNKTKFANAPEIIVYGKQIASLKGIEYFTGLTKLVCADNQLTSLDLSKNTALTSLDCSVNQLSSLDVSLNTALTSLRCYKNQLPSLDVYLNTLLTELLCHTNQMSDLDINTCPSLTTLTCGNQHANGGTGTTYTKMNLTCTESQKALIKGPEEAQYNNNVVTAKSIAFPDANFRTWLIRNRCEPTTDGTDIDITHDKTKAFFATTSINVTSENIASLKGIEYFTKLETLICMDNKLTSLDLRKNTALTKLACQRNQLTSLDLSLNTKLTDLTCEANNTLTSLDIRKCTELTSLICNGNLLTNLNVTNNTKLRGIYCASNKLESLDVSKNTALTQLYCETNKLKSLVVSKNTKLTKLYCHDNLLPSLNISACLILDGLRCGNQSTDGGAKLQLTCSKSQKALTTNSVDLPLNQNVAFERIIAFPDPKFRAAVETLGCILTADKADIDLEAPLTKDVFAKTTSLEVYSRNIVSMDGVEYFTALTGLSCYNNHLTSLDIRPLTSLRAVLCGQQLAGGAVAPSYSEMKLYMTQTQFSIDLGGTMGGVIQGNEKVTRIVVQ